jgi:hypothetical protein
MDRRHRDLYKTFDKHGVEIVERINTVGHLKFRLRNPNGIERTFTFSSSPSDTNAQRVVHRQIRSFAQEIKQTATRSP